MIVAVDLANRHRREEAVRALDAELSRIKERMVLLEAALKGRDKEVERLGRELEAAKVAEAEVRSVRSRQ